MPDELRHAPATVVGRVRIMGGGHVTIQLRGFGMAGSRPLLGEVVCSPAEADYLMGVLEQAYDRALDTRNEEQ